MAVRSWSVQLVKDKYNMCVCTSVKVFEINLYGTRNNKNNKTSRKKTEWKLTKRNGTENKKSHKIKPVKKYEKGE